jgi:hypothetical protein
MFLVYKNVTIHWWSAHSGLGRFRAPQYWRYARLCYQG